MQDGRLIILKPYVDDQHEDQNNNMVFVEKVNNLSKLMKHIRSKYIEKSSMSVSLTSNYGKGQLLLISKTKSLF